MYYLKPETTNENEKSYEAKCVFGENGSTETIISTNTKSERLTSGFAKKTGQSGLSCYSMYTKTGT